MYLKPNSEPKQLLQFFFSIKVKYALLNTAIK